MLNKKNCVFVFLIVLIFLSVNVLWASDSLNQTLQSQEDCEVLTQVDNVSIKSESSPVNSSLDNSKTIQSGDVTKYYNSKTRYSAIFLDNNGNVLKNTNVKITVNKKAYNKKTDSNGLVLLKVNFKPGTYTIVSYNPITGYKLTNTFKILSTIKSEDISKVYKDNRKFYATFLKNNGKVLAKKTVKFKINGKTHKVKTDKFGVASLSLKNLKKGNYKIISYNVDKLTKTNTIKVVKTSSTGLKTYRYTFLKGDKTKTVKVKLLNKFGHAPSKGKIIKLKIDGKTYSGKTNAGGFAKIKLPSLKTGIYKVKYSFKGTSVYKKSSALDKVVIIPSKNPTFTIKSPTVFKYGEDNVFKIALTSGKIPLEKRTVIFTLNGNTYDRITDSDGIATLPVNLDEGNYYISYLNKPDLKLNSKTQSTLIQIIDKNPTKITWESGNTFYQGTQNFKVLLKDVHNNPLGNKNIQLSIASKTYSSPTTQDGYATFKINLTMGTYPVAFKYLAENDPDNKASQGHLDIEVIKKDLTGNGYWMYESDMVSLDLNALASQGASDLFINSPNLLKNGKLNLESWISNAKTLGIRVHIWMQTFYSPQTGWVNPVLNGKINENFFNEKIQEAVNYTSINGISGIYLDYLRYSNDAYKTSGGSEAIDEFSVRITQAIHDINSNLIVSCGVMAETYSNIYNYGQNYPALSRYFDVVIPLIFKGDYSKDSSWIKDTSKWFVDNSKGANVWIGLQGYQSNNSIVKLPLSEITDDVQSALLSRASGVVIYRFGQTNLINFNIVRTTVNNTTNSSNTDSGNSNSTNPSINNNTNSSTSNSTNPSVNNNTDSSKFIAIKDIVTSANDLNIIVKSKDTVPDTIKVSNNNFSPSEFLYLMTKAVEYIYLGKDNIQPVKSQEPSNPTGNAKSGKIYLSQYVDMAMDISSFIENSGVAPNYSGSPLGNIKYSDLIEIFCEILTLYDLDKKLPDYISFYGLNQSVVNPKTVSIDDIVRGGLKLCDYYTQKRIFPVNVTINNYDYTLPETLYLMSQAIYQISNNNFNSVNVMLGVKNPQAQKGDVIKENWMKDDYVRVAKNVANFILINNAAPNYANSGFGRVMYADLLDSFSKILDFYAKNNRLPNYIVFSNFNPI